MTSDTLKEYYIKLEKLWNDSLNVLNAINQSLKTTADDVEISLTNLNNNNEIVKYKIPSFLYLENKLETLSNNFNNLFNLPEAGEAWLTSDDSTNSFKVQLIRSGISPVAPEVDTSETMYASTTSNNILKDMVSPKTFIKLNISNLPENIDKMLVRKYIINNSSVFNSLKTASSIDGFDMITSLYSLRRGIDYDYYDSAISLPIKQSQYETDFYIEEIIGSPVVVEKKYTYTVKLNTLKYTDVNDPSIEYSLRIGDKLCLGRRTVVYRITRVDKNTNQIEIEEVLGHYAIQTYYEDQSMVLGIYKNKFSEFHYIDIPLEEDPYICVTLATIQDNVQSKFSKPTFINLNEIIMTDEKGQIMYDSNMNKLTYIDYYKKYCTNIGDLIVGLTSTSYPQLTAINNLELERLITDDSIKAMVTSTIDGADILKVLPINKHIIDNKTTEEVIAMHAQKSELLSQITAVNNSIAEVNNTLATTDFSQQVAVTQQSLRNTLMGHYSSRIELQKQLITVVEGINANLTQIEGKAIKYRIRGIAESENLETHIHSTFGDNIDLIGIDVEYKYKGVNRDVTTLTNINSSIFTDWNKLISIDKERLVEINSNGGFNLVFENYNSTNNIIKWNQIDIPISADEDVVIRIRYKYNIGQPFIDVYTPWSDEITISFPVEYKDNVEVTTIIAENRNDIISSKFNSTLINEGYAEHINDAFQSNDVKFLHVPENIYSGFNTPENNMISLKDKLQQMSSEILEYRKILDNEINTKYKVYLAYDGQQIELLPNTTNKHSVYNKDHILHSFIKKEMTLIFKNEGQIPVKMYSIFPGNVTTPLIFNVDNFYERTIGNYERVPMVVNELHEYQTLGQWIYFRQNNPWTGKDIYFNNTTQNRYDWTTNDEDGCIWASVGVSSLMKRDFNQVLFGWRRRDVGQDMFSLNSWKTMKFDPMLKTFTHNTDDQDYGTAKDNIYARYEGVKHEYFMYKNINNNYLARYEDIYYDDEGVRYYLDNETSLIEFVAQHDIPGDFNDDINFVGAFLYPELESTSQVLTEGGVGDYVEIPVGGSISVPISLEFYLNEDLTAVTKGLYFDIKPSAFSNPVHYMLEITALYDYTSSGNLLGNVSLVDETIE